MNYFNKEKNAETSNSSQPTIKAFDIQLAELVSIRKNIQESRNCKKIGTDQF
jgi:hypothetical protein